MSALQHPTGLFGPSGEQRAARLGLAVWIGYAVLIVVGTWLLGPERQSVVNHYRRAAWAWLGGEPLYSGTDAGFLYLPSFAVLYTPFALLPEKLGGALWRVLSLAVLGLGLWRMSCAGEASRRARTFLVASAWVLPLAYASARHGQSTLAMAGAMLAAAAALAEQRFGRAALWCGVGLVCKPLMVVFLLLAAAAERRLIVPLLATIVVVLLLPWLAQAPAYVAQQHLDCLRMFRLAGDPTELLRFPDLICGLRSLGLILAPAVALGLRALAALATLGAYLFLRRRWLGSGPRGSGEPGPVQPGSVQAGYHVALALYLLVAVYLVLFNPRTEHNSYSLLGPAIGLAAALAWLEQGRWRLALAYALLGLCIWQDRDLLRPLTGGSGTWTKPLLTLLFLALAWRQLCRSRAEPERPSPPWSGEAGRTDPSLPGVSPW